MHEHISVDDEEQDRRNDEESEQREVNIEKGQLDRILYKEIGVCHPTRSHG